MEKSKFNIIIIVAAAIVVIIGISAVVYSINMRTASYSTTTYANTSERYSITYPSTWTKKEGIQGASVLLNSPLAGSNDLFSDNINVMSDTLGPNSTFSDYIDTSIENLKKALPDFQLADRISQGTDREELKYTATVTNIEKPVKVFTRQLYARNGNKLYVITATADFNNQTQFEKEISEVLSSFKTN